MKDSFLTELKELIKIILTDENTKKKLDSIDNLKEIYNIFKDKGFSGDYEVFKKFISKIFQVSEKEIEEVSGGIITNSSLKKFIATAMSSVTLLGSSMSTLKALNNNDKNSVHSNNDLKFEEENSDIDNR